MRISIFVSCYACQIWQGAVPHAKPASGWVASSSWETLYIQYTEQLAESHPTLIKKHLVEDGDNQCMMFNLKR